MHDYRIGGKPAEAIGRLLGLKLKANLVKFTEHGDGSYKLIVQASDESLEINVDEELETGDPLRYDISTSDETVELEELPEDYPYRIGLAHTMVLSAIDAQLRSYGKKRKR